MKPLRTGVLLVLLAVLAVCVYGWWRTTPTATAARQAARSLTDGTQPEVDSAALDRARALLVYATTAEEQRLARSALEKADHLLDLAFADALREATQKPPPDTPAVHAAQAQLDAAAARLVDDNLQLAKLNAAIAARKGTHDQALDGELAVTEAQFEVDQYGFNQASRELVAAGGDQRARIQALVTAHQAASPKTLLPPVAPPPARGLIHQLVRSWELRRKARALDAALDQDQSQAAGLADARAALLQHISELGTHRGNATADAATRLALTRQIAESQLAIAGIDSRITTLRDLARDYSEWRALLGTQFTEVIHSVLRDLAIIAATGLVLMIIGRTFAIACGRLSMDRRQIETLRTVLTVALQIAALLFIALIIIGPPSQLGVFLGLAGAGLTVALKDFIVAFLGWLVLMGRNGMRLGDWVEINGVAGEVVQLGIFHTVLLETGNWTDSGHPTGRRVTFTNSFAIEGHYFNFSTTGQWLWDELQVVVPTGQDVYAFVAAITVKVREATAAHAREAEEEWRRAAPSRQLKGLSSDPAISVKPVVGGTEISLRYIARANERYALRAALYEAAVSLLGGAAAATTAA